MTSSEAGSGHTQNDELTIFLGAAGRLVCSGTTSEKFLAWASKSAKHFLPELVRSMRRPADAHKMLHALSIKVWNQTPIPSNQWQPQPVKPPGSHEACWCGSGEKYQDCCSTSAIADMPPINMLRFVLDCYPASRLGEISNSGHTNLDAVADTALQWCNEGQSKRAVALLEPFFAAPQPLTAALEPLFDELMSALMDQGRDKRREHWIKEILARGDNALKSTALQRRAALHADQDRTQEAWADFAQAQRFNPNDPSLSMLEVTLLMEEGRTQLAAERAHWWAEHLGKLRDPALAELVAHLQAFASEPASAMLGVACAQFPGVERLVNLLKQAPPPQLLHTLHADPSPREPAALALPPIGQIEADPALSQLEAQWSKVFKQVKPAMTAVQNDASEVWSNADDWLDLLQRSPALWNSFEVLDDLVMAVDALVMPSMLASLMLQLAERAAELLRLLCETQPAPVSVPWGFQAHRPVLRPIAHLAFVCKEDGKWERFMALARWLVLELNPNDNHGLRYELSYALMLHDRDQDALTLCQRYPNESSLTLDLNRALACYRLGDLAQAEAALRQAKKTHPKTITMLLKPNPKPVKPEDWGITAGGAYEAWLYVQPHLPLWEQCGALAWARAVLKK